MDQVVTSTDFARFEFARENGLRSLGVPLWLLVLGCAAAAAYWFWRARCDRYRGVHAVAVGKMRGKERRSGVVSIAVLLIFIVDVLIDRGEHPRVTGALGVVAVPVAAMEGVRFALDVMRRLQSFRDWRRLAVTATTVLGVLGVARVLIWKFMGL